MTAMITYSLVSDYSGSIFRLLISLLMALIVTIGLFWVMQNLIETADYSLDH